ncbi:uncharacterized protein C8R40DRAFT_1066135 [Lentinula edodes]|uniref:uncharacterized protein n=1 Tax=Lentinula edodes TaxID=5353 RepID=UPI001E8DA776|nr:uncharacterized protein C8R40DRAFT_1066135 [Lentinula edodes]KAH7879998.1 hypothetical protein C8R40DRAFT_1066135 [Lentinula edodes]
MACSNRYMLNYPPQTVLVSPEARGAQMGILLPMYPLANTPGIPARCYEVKKQGSRYFGRVYLGCGKTRQRCQWKVRLDLVFSAAAAACHPVSSEELEFPDPKEFDELFNKEFAQLIDKLHIGDKGSALQVITRKAPGSKVGEDFAKLFGSLDLSEDEYKYAESCRCISSSKHGNLTLTHGRRGGPNLKRAYPQ